MKILRQSSFGMYDIDLNTKNKNVHIDKELIQSLINDKSKFDKIKNVRIDH
jgi:hypothetical protein